MNWDLSYRSKKCFQGCICKFQADGKLSAKKFGTFIQKKLIGRNAFQLDLPGRIKIHPTLHVTLTTPFLEQPLDIAVEFPIRPAHIFFVYSNEHVVDKNINHQ